MVYLIYRYIDIEDSEQILRAIRTIPPNIPIEVIIHIPGELVLAAVQIALVLAANEILMDPHAVLCPIDPQLSGPRAGTMSTASILRVVREKGES